MTVHDLHAHPRFDSLPRRPRLSQEVARRISERIRAEGLAPGDQLPTESRLVEEFGVSRSVVREAVAHLRSEGLVEAHQGKGVFVTDPARRKVFRLDANASGRARDLLAIFELRREVETGAAGLAARRADEAQRERLRDLVAAMAATQDEATSAELDIAFHGTIAEATGNACYRDFTQYLDRQLRLAIEAARKQAALAPEQAARILAEHRAVCDAIVSGRPNKARKAMRAHLDNVVQRLGLEEAAR